MTGITETGEPHSPAAVAPEEVAIVDDDAALCDSLRWLLESVELPVRTYSTGEALLEDLDPRIGCILLDVRMPGMSGLQVQQRLNELQAPVAVLIMTGHGDVPMAVHTLKQGAFDFIEKPFNDQQLIDAVQQALDHTARRRQEQSLVAELRRRYEALRPKEKEILRLAALGYSNRAVAEEIGASAKTVEVYRLRGLRQMQAQDLAHWVRMATALELLPPLHEQAAGKPQAGPGTGPA